MSSLSLSLLDVFFKELLENFENSFFKELPVEFSRLNSVINDAISKQYQSYFVLL